MKAINQEFYGDDMRWFLATVIDSSPPAGLEGRVKIRIHGIHSPKPYDIPQRDLPWAQVMTPGDTYGTSGLGTSSQVLPGALVFGIFLDGVTSQLPFVLGSMPRIEFPSTIQAEGREDPSVNPFALDFKQTNSSMISPRRVNNTETMSRFDVARFFIDNGMKVKAASSIVGVLEDISKLDPRNKDNDRGIGIAGWPLQTSRYKRFSAYIGRLHPSRNLYDMEGQLMYVMHELQTTQSLAWSKLLRTNDIVGKLYGEKVDGIDEKGNGMVAAVIKYYVHPEIRGKVSQSNAEMIAESIYFGLGAR